MNLVWLFPGQSSRYAGMLTKLSALAPQLGAYVQEASELLGRDLAAIDQSEAPFSSNRDIQVSVFLANLLCQKALEAQGLSAPFSAGLSLGQYNHLVHIKALRWQDALHLVDARGCAYDQGPSGAMASIQPVGLQELFSLLGERCGTPGSHGDLEIVNRNSPRQQVIAGTQEAVSSACEYLEQEHYLAPIIIERKIPMHASRFAPVAASMESALRKAPLLRPSKPYLCNTDAKLQRGVGPEDLRKRLAAHVCSPVLWQDSIETLIREVPNPVMVEVGAMGVLSGLLHRKWVRVPKYKCDVKEGLLAHFEQMVKELARLQDTAGVQPMEAAHV